MLQTEIYTELERRLGPLNETTKQAVDIALELVGHPGTDTPPASPLVFQGENPSFEEMANLSARERGRILKELEQRNRAWLDHTLRALGARWILVVDGKVLRHSPTLENYLADDQLLDLCRECGKVPLLFMPLRPIEESTRWRATVYTGDAYPTLPLRVSNGIVNWDITADFDTGCSEAYLDADTLAQQNILQITEADPIHEESHIGRRFEYVRKTLRLALVDEQGAWRETAQIVICILNWRQSPFVVINPNRTALVGRDLCLQLQPDVTLSFARRETTLQW